MSREYEENKNQKLNYLFIVFILFSCLFSCQSIKYDYSLNSAEILQKEKIKRVIYIEFFCGIDTLPLYTTETEKIITEYGRKGQRIKEEKWSYNTYTIFHYENDKPILKIEYQLNTMERRDSTVYTYTKDTQNMIWFDKKNSIRLTSKSQLDKFGRTIEHIDYDSTGKEILKMNYEYDNIGVKEKKIVYNNNQYVISKRVQPSKGKLIYENYDKDQYQGGEEYTFDNRNRLVHLFHKKSNMYYQESWSYNNIGLIDRHIVYNTNKEEWKPSRVGYYTYEKWE